MIQLLRGKINLILGILIGFLLGGIILVEGYTILIVGQMQEGIYLSIPTGEFNKFKILAIVTFIVTILIFNTRKLKSLNLNKLSIYLISSIIISIIVTIVAITVMSSVVLRVYSNIDVTKINPLIYINTLYVIIFISIAIFLVVFVALVNKKVKYIKFLTKEVKIIKNDRFGKVIDVKGNDELAELCISINNMSLELKEKINNEKIIEKNKNELITNVSHDLRTPLTSIIGYVDLLKRNGFNDKEKFDEYIDILDKRSKSLNNLINELFEYTRLTGQDTKLNRNKVEVVSLIEQLIGEYIPIFNEVGLEIKKEIIDRDIFINVDVEKIIRALENILTNAKKYSIKNSRVMVKLFEENNNVIISIVNKVEDICKDDLDNIFERFYKIDKSRNGEKGTGLGLAIVKRIIELHDGNISVTLNDNIIDFKIVLPINI